MTLKLSWKSVSDIPTSVFGEHLRQQVEDRLKFYETGEPPAKNIDVMSQALTKVRNHFFLFLCLWLLR